MKNPLSTWLALGVLTAGAGLTAIAGVALYERQTQPVWRADPRDVSSTEAPMLEQEALAAANPGFLYGRVTTDDDVTYEGRLRWGRASGGRGVLGRCLQRRQERQSLG